MNAERVWPAAIVRTLTLAAIIAVLLAMSAHLVQAAEAPEELVDRACSDDEVRRQIIERWRGFDATTDTYLRRYLRDPRGLIDLYGSVSADISRHQTELHRAQTALQIDLTALAGRAGLGGTAKALQELLKKWKIKDPVGLKKALDKVLGEIQKEAKFAPTDAARLKTRLEKIQTLVDELVELEELQPRLPGIRRIQVEIETLISGARPQPLDLEFPSRVTGEINTPIDFAVKVKGGCPPYSITIRNPDDSLMPNVSVGPTRDATTTSKLTFRRAGIFTDNVIEAVDRVNTRIQRGFTAEIDDPATKATVKIRKLASATVVNPGDRVTYSVSVTNTGKPQLDRVRITDEKCSPMRYVRGGTNFSSGILDPNETWEFECSTVLHATTDNTAIVEAYSLASASVKVTDKATARVIVQPPGAPPAATLHVSVRDQTTRQEIANPRVDLTPVAGWKQQDASGIRFDALPVDTYDVTAVADGYASGSDRVVITQQQDYLVVIWLNKTPEETAPRPQLTVRLECGGLVEVVPGENSRPCGVIVEGWRSDTSEPVNVVFTPNPPPGRVQISPGDTSADGTNMHTAGVKTSGVDRYVFFEGFSAAVGAPASSVPLSVTVKQGEAQVVLPLTVVVVPKGVPTPTSMRPPSGPPGPASGGSGAFTARLECGGLVEVVPGEVSKSCGVIVEGWRSDTTEPVEIEVVWPRQSSGIDVFPGSTRSEPGSMFNPGVKTSAVDQYVFSEGFSARENAPAGTTNVTIRVRQRGAGEIELGLAAVVVPKGGKPTGPIGATGPGVGRGSSGQLSAELDCGDSFELAPGDVVGRTCGVVVRGWRSDVAGPVEVEVVWPRQSSGIDVSPGSTSAEATVMYSSGVSDTADRYVFSEGFTARPDAPPGTTTVNITVRQRGVGDVPLRVNVNVLRKGLLPGDGPGIRPPATVAAGTGGQFCVWRYKLVGDKPACFHFAAADCTTPRYNNPRNGYELVGQNMKWSEADARVQELSRYFDDSYGCSVASGGTPPAPPPTTGSSDPGPEAPPEKPPVAGPVEPDPPVPSGPFLSRFGVQCSPAELTLGDASGATPGVRCQAFGVYSDKPDTTLDVTTRSAWSLGPTFTPVAPGALVVTASLEGASQSATVTVRGGGYDPSADPRAGDGGRAGAPIVPPDPGSDSNPSNPPKPGLGGGPVAPQGPYQTPPEQTGTGTAQDPPPPPPPPGFVPGGTAGPGVGQPPPPPGAPPTGTPPGRGWSGPGGPGRGAPPGQGPGPIASQPKAPGGPATPPPQSPPSACKSPCHIALDGSGKCHCPDAPGPVTGPDTTGAELTGAWHATFKAQPTGDTAYVELALSYAGNRKCGGYLDIGGANSHGFRRAATVEVTGPGKLRLAYEDPARGPQTADGTYTASQIVLGAAPFVVGRGGPTPFSVTLTRSK